MKSLKDKKILITGAASGIGKETAMQMATAGAKIIALDVNPSGLDDLVRQITENNGICRSLICNLASEDEISKAAQEAVGYFHGLDVLINNAGIGFHGPTHEMTHEQRARILQVNLNGPFALFQHLIDPLMNSKSGHLVNISSIFGLVPYQKTAAYCASKYGLVGMSEAIRAEYGRWGLGVTVVCPGFVDTPMLNQLPDSSQSGQKLRRPSRWLTTTPEKIARKIIRAILRNKRLVLATPLAHFLYHSKRLFPGTFDFVQTFKSPKWKDWFRSNPLDSEPLDSEPSSPDGSSISDRRAA